MVGLGETRQEIMQVMDDLRIADVDFLTIGQYLQPTIKHAAVEAFITPDEFAEYAPLACAKYPEFLPWCVAARVRSRTDKEVHADLTIGYGPFRESFTSRVTPSRPDRIDVHYEKGPFKYLNNH